MRPRDRAQGMEKSCRRNQHEVLATAAPHRCAASRARLPGQSRRLDGSSLFDYLIGPSSSDGGMVRPRALAVLRLMTSSNLVGCWTGRSPAFAPLKILST